MQRSNHPVSHANGPNAATQRFIAALGSNKKVLFRSVARDEKGHIPRYHSIWHLPVDQTVHLPT